MAHHAVDDNDAQFVAVDRYKRTAQIAAIQQHRVSDSPGCDNCLIHDPARHVCVMMFSTLAEKRQSSLVHIAAVERQ